MSVENELYEKWRNSTGAERSELEGRLFHAVVRHAQAVVWTSLREWNPDLAQEIALAAFRNLPRFRGDSKFSTWVHAIGRNKVRELLRNRTRWRKIFAQSPVFERQDKEREHDSNPLEFAGKMPDFETQILVDELCEGLNRRDAILFRCKCEKMSSDEIATILGMTTEAVDSCWARLKLTLKKKFAHTTANKGLGQLI
jgi:RNA polymerase sigma factor (sigma-70 family)